MTDTTGSDGLYGFTAYPEALNILLPLPKAPQAPQGYTGTLYGVPIDDAAIEDIHRPLAMVSDSYMELAIKAQGESVRDALWRQAQ